MLKTPKKELRHVEKNFHATSRIHDFLQSAWLGLSLWIFVDLTINREIFPRRIRDLRVGAGGTNEQGRVKSKILIAFDSRERNDE